MAGEQDVEPPASTRVYYLAGTHHLPGSLPLSDTTAAGLRLQYPLNTVDFRPVLRAALLNLDRWVRGQGDVEPVVATAAARYDAFRGN